MFFTLSFVVLLQGWLSCVCVGGGGGGGERRGSVHRFERFLMGKY